MSGQGENPPGPVDLELGNHCSGAKPGEAQSHASQLSQLRILLENNLTTATEEEVQSSSKHVSFEVNASLSSLSLLRLYLSLPSLPPSLSCRLCSPNSTIHGQFATTISLIFCSHEPKTRPAFIVGGRILEGGVGD